MKSVPGITERTDASGRTRYRVRVRRGGGAASTEASSVLTSSGVSTPERLLFRVVTDRPYPSGDSLRVRANTPLWPTCQQAGVDRRLSLSL
jgi:hypothetical protein